MRIDLKLDSLLIRSLVTTGFLACLILLGLSVTTLFGNAVARGADEPAAAEFAAQLAPQEPFAYYLSAVLLERSMRAEDLPRSLAMYEKAAALEPNDYLLWLELGKAKERNGDPQAAEKALRHAAEVAPNYSEVNWSLGNVLIRNGKDDEGFSYLRKAAEGNSKFAGPAASLAWDLFEGDIRSVTGAVGDSMPVKAAIAGLLARQEKFEEALKIWKTIPATEVRSQYPEAGKQILQAFLKAKRYAAAAEIQAQLSDEGPRVGVVTNGGFESDVSQKGAGAFDWNISAGKSPTIGISVEQKRAGERSLALIFGDEAKTGFRQIGQAVAVNPGKTYRFSASYKSELKTPKTMRWDIVDAATNELIASTDAFLANSGWTSLSAEFSTADGSEGVIIRLVREKCAGSECDIRGRLWLDEIAISGL